MINIKKKEDCCGCSACAQICPKNCIEMQFDEEGFLYPKVNLSLCINCHKCEVACPVINHSDFQHVVKPVGFFAAKNKSAASRMNSSSGGVFIELAKKVIDNNGVVFGAAFDECFNVKHIFSDTMSGVEKMMGSKYVQSSIGDTFAMARTYLKDERLVLFSGTPCQIAGLKRFLQKDYLNLITVDIVCHGVPSPKIWEQYLSDICDIEHPAPIESVAFRVKEDFGWEHYGMTIRDSNRYLFKGAAGANPYMRAFLTNNIIRPICYDCRHKRKSGADITLGDFWGIKNVLPDFYDEKGVSMVVFNTLKGEQFFPKESFEWRESDYNIISIYNKSYSKSTLKPIERQKFFKLYRRGVYSIDEIVNSIIPDLSGMALSKKCFFLPSRIYRFLIRKYYLMFTK